MSCLLTFVSCVSVTDHRRNISYQPSVGVNVMDIIFQPIKNPSEE